MVIAVCAGRAGLNAIKASLFAETVYATEEAPGCSTISTVHCADTPVWLLVTVITVLPTAAPVTRPFSSTTAMLSSADVQVTLVSAAFEGRTLASSCAVPPT